MFFELELYYMKVASDFCMKPSLLVASCPLLFAISSGLTRRGFGAGAFECVRPLKLFTFFTCGENSCYLMKRSYGLTDCYSC